MKSCATCHWTTKGRCTLFRFEPEAAYKCSAYLEGGPNEKRIEQISKDEKIEKEAV